LASVKPLIYLKKPFLPNMILQSRPLIFFKYILFWLLGLYTLTTYGQFGKPKLLNPVKWEKPTANKTTAQIGEIVEITFTAQIDDGWYMYSSEGLDENVMAIPTTFTFEPSPSYELVGRIVPIKPKQKFDATWNGNVMYFDKKAIFTQKIKLKTTDFNLKVTVEYQVCNDESCLPPTPVELSFSEITVTPASQPEIAKIPEKSVSTIQPKPTDTIPANRQATDTVVAGSQPPVSNESLPVPTSATTEEEGLGWFMLYAFLFGIAAIFTPCVFPMIPITVSYFTNQPKQKGKFQAIVYGISIILIYTLFGTIVAPLFGPAFGNWLSTHWLPNLLFFVIFIVFALSFLGMFEIVLPSSLVNKVDAQAEKGGLIGVFFMAFTLVLVSFSCTGPIVGSIMVQSAGGALLKPIAGMFAFGVAFGLPFGLFAFFPSVLQSLPKSGGWLTSVKVTLGFIELALAFKFLSIIDQVYHLGILDRHINIAIWIAIALFMGLYFLGKITMPHDTKPDVIPVPRMLLALACFTLVIYLIPGMFGAPLQSFSGLLPPSSTHNFDIKTIIREELNSSGIIRQSSQPINVRHSDKFKMPHGIKGYFDLKEAQNASKAQNKPLLIDFTGHGCVNCRKMEDIVWADARVQNALNNDVVLVSLYVDDRTVLPENEWVTSSFDGKIYKTIGGVNADYQITHFGTNAQPYYVLLSPEGKLLTEPIGYQTDVAKFLAFLAKAKTTF